MKIYFLSFLILLFFSCQNEKKNKEELDNTSIVIESGSNENTNDENDFFKYLSNFETIELPITIKGCEDNFDKLKPFDGKTYNGFDEEYSLPYGKYSLNENFL